MTKPRDYLLYGAKGGGSTIVEAAFARTALPVEFVDLGWDDVGCESRTLAPLNPLGQVPTLVMPDGTVMTESAAIICICPNRRRAPRWRRPSGIRSGR